MVPQGNQDRCDNEACVICTTITHDEITSTDGIKHSDVYTEAVVYYVKNTKCSKEVYVAENDRRMEDRIKEHLADVRQRRENAVGHHFKDKKTFNSEHWCSDFGDDKWQIKN